MRYQFDRSIYVVCSSQQMTMQCSHSLTAVYTSHLQDATTVELAIKQC